MPRQFTYRSLCRCSLSEHCKSIFPSFPPFPSQTHNHRFIARSVGGVCHLLPEDHQHHSAEDFSSVPSRRLPLYRFFTCTTQ